MCLVQSIGLKSANGQQKEYSLPCHLRPCQLQDKDRIEKKQSIRTTRYLSRQQQACQKHIVEQLMCQEPPEAQMELSTFCTTSILHTTHPASSWRACALVQAMRTLFPPSMFQLPCFALDSMSCPSNLIQSSLVIMLN